MVSPSKTPMTLPAKSFGGTSCKNWLKAANKTSAVLRIKSLAIYKKLHGIGTNHSGGGIDFLFNQSHSDAPALRAFICLLTRRPWG